MGSFGLLLLMVIILAIMGLGWKTFTPGVIAGFEKAVDVGTPVIKNPTEEAGNYMNNPDHLMSDSHILHTY